MANEKMRTTAFIIIIAGDFRSGKFELNYKITN